MIYSWQHKTQESLIGDLGISRAEYARWAQTRGFPGKSANGFYDARAIRAWARKKGKKFQPAPDKSLPAKATPTVAMHIAGLTDDEPAPGTAKDVPGDQSGASEAADALPSISGLTDDAPDAVELTGYETSALKPAWDPADETAYSDALSVDPLQEGRRIRNERERIKLANEKQLIISAERARDIANALGRAHVAMLQELPARLAAHFPEIEAKLFRDRCRTTLADLRGRNVAALAKILADELGPDPAIETVLAKIKLTKDTNGPIQPASTETAEG